MQRNMDFTSKDEDEAKEKLSTFTYGTSLASRLNDAKTVIPAEKQYFASPFLPVAIWSVYTLVHSPIKAIASKTLLDV